MPVINQGPNRFEGVSSIKLTANMSQITISDSPDSQVHTEKTNGAIVTTRQDGPELKVTGNMAHIDLKVPVGVHVDIINNLSTIKDQRSGSQASPTPTQKTENAPGPDPLPLAGLRAPAQGSTQAFQGVQSIEGVNQMGTIEIHRGEPGSETRIHYNGSAMIDQQGAGLDIVNRGGAMTIITPESTKVQIIGNGQIVDRRFQ